MEGGGALRLLAGTGVLRRNFEAGGLSGAPLAGRSMEVLRLIRAEVPAELKSEQKRLQDELDAMENEEEPEDGFGDDYLDRQSNLEEALELVADRIAEFVRFDPKKMKSAGCYVYVNHDGRLVVERGLVKKKDEKELAKATTKEDRARITKELQDYAKGLDLTTEAGQENQTLLNRLAEAAHDKAQKDLEAGSSLKDLRKGMKDSRADFIENAQKLGASKKAAEQMADKFGITKGYVDDLARSVDDFPASKQIKVEADTKAAEAA